MSGAASKELMEFLHNLTVEQLTEVIRKGEPVIENGELARDASGNPIYKPASAAYFANAIKLLKDNNVTAILTPNSPMKGLVDSLPTFEDDEGELPVH